MEVHLIHPRQVTHHLLLGLPQQHLPILQVKTAPQQHLPILRVMIVPQQHHLPTLLQLKTPPHQLRPLHQNPPQQLHNLLQQVKPPLRQTAPCQVTTRRHLQQHQMLQPTRPHLHQPLLPLLQHSLLQQPLHHQTPTLVSQLGCLFACANGYSPN